MEEVFSYHHSKLRNVVERIFGVAKDKWQMLKGMPNYPKHKEGHIILACFALHNFVRDDNARSALIDRMAIPAGSECSRLWVQANAEDDMATIRNWITTGLAIMGMRYASLNHDCDADVHDLVGNKNEAESEGRACYDTEGFMKLDVPH